jgi:HPt (histidine-containing phosphotransfer) domain-containing protein
MLRDVILPPESLGCSTPPVDPELHALVADYVSRLPERALTLEERFAAGDLEALRSEAHQLKGSAGAYGFPRITAAAADLEASLGARQLLDAVRRGVASVAALCRAAGSAA